MVNNLYREARIALKIPLRTIKEVVDKELEPLSQTVSIPTIYRFETGIRKKETDAKYMVLQRYYDQIKRNYDRKIQLDKIDKMGEEDEHM